MDTLIPSIFRTPSTGFEVILNMEVFLQNHVFFTVYDPFCRGNSSIAGTVRVLNVLSKRRVSLFERQSMRLVTSTESDEITGTFIFSNIASDRQYVILVDDDEQVYNASVADWVYVDVN